MKKTRKQSVKAFLLGVIVTSIFMTTVFGGQLKESIDVIFNSIKISVNGQDQDIDNFLYQDTTYVPLRAISEIFNKEVTWDGESRRASISDIDLSYFNGDSFFNGDYLNIRNQFLSSLYSQPADIDLFELFYCGSQFSESMTDEELKAVMAEENMTMTIEELPCPCEKNSRSNMDKILSDHMGISLADTNKVRLDQFNYLPQYDAYYHFHGDTNYRRNVSFSRAERQGDIIRLFYNDSFFGDGEKVLTLKEKDNTYLFLANEKVE